nr:hypothetical protein [Bacteroidota bacterium]
MKQLALFLMLSASAIFMFPACQQPVEHAHAPEINMDSVKAQIVALENRFAVASNAKDIDGVVAYYASDAESYANNETIWVGMDVIKAGIK